MSTFIKPIITCICFSIIAFILLDKFGGSEYFYYEKKYKNEILNGVNYRIGYWEKTSIDHYYANKEKNKKTTEELDYKRKNRKHFHSEEIIEILRAKQFNYKALIFSIAIAIGTFTLMYKQTKKAE